MHIPLVLPFPIFFIYLFLKVMIIILAPFVLGMIVRIRSQASDKIKVKANQNFHKAKTPPPSPSSDGEDKPEDSYWTRFKRWCSDHSLAIGLGITLVAATLIYVYRENISDLVYGSQPEEKKENKGKQVLRPFEPISEEKKAVAQEAINLAKEICNASFFVEGEEINGEIFVRKAQNLGRQMVEIHQYYDQKEISTPNDLLAKRKIAFFETEFPGIIEKAYVTDDNFEENIAFAENQLSRKVEDRDPAFNKELALIAQRKGHNKAIRLYNIFFEILYVYVLEALEQDSVANS